MTTLARGIDFNPDPSTNGKLTDADCAGLDFIFLKVSQWPGYRAEYLKEAIETARRNGLKVYLYIYGVNAHGGAQTDYGLDYIESLGYKVSEFDKFAVDQEYNATFPQITNSQVKAALNRARERGIAEAGRYGNAATLAGFVGEDFKWECRPGGPNPLGGRTKVWQDGIAGGIDTDKADPAWVGSEEADMTPEEHQQLGDLHGELVGINTFYAGQAKPAPADPKNPKSWETARASGWQLAHDAAQSGAGAPSGVAPHAHDVPAGKTGGVA